MDKRQETQQTPVIKPCPPSIEPAGMRADSRSKETGAAIPSDDSLKEEIIWRMEHRQ